MPAVVQYMIYSTQRVVSCCKSRTALRAHINYNVLSSELTWTKHILVLGTMTILEFPEQFIEDRWGVLVLRLANDAPR